jgi:integrase/recombinase XerC
MTRRKAALPATRTDTTIQLAISAHTLRNYLVDYRDFARFLSTATQRDLTEAQALDLLTGLPNGQANALALAFREHLQGRNLAPSTIARRLSALRTAVDVARTIGRVSWHLAIQSPKVTPYRDTRGPGQAGWRRMLDLATRNAQASPRGKRDLAILRLLHDLALRRFEVTGLDVEHVDLGEGRVRILGKGQTQRITLTLPDPTRKALTAWLDVRGNAGGPLFTRIRNGQRTTDYGRLTGEAVRLMVAALGRAAGVERVVRPHGLRHQAITRALDLTGGDVRAVREFSRHKKLETLLVYDDARRDAGGKVAGQVAEE